MTQEAPGLWLILACITFFAGNKEVLGAVTTRKGSSTTTKPLQHNQTHSTPKLDPTNSHVMQLQQILRDTKIKQNRQWAEGQPCPQGWLHFNDSCYWGSLTPSSWFAAEHECRSFGYDAHLASVHGPDENTRVQAMAGCGASWIGLTKMNPSQTGNPAAGWGWTDTSDNNFFAWRSGNPIGVDERNCAYQDKGSAAAGGNGWANGYCTELRVFTCKADAKINGAEGESESGEGESGGKEGEKGESGKGETAKGEAEKGKGKNEKEGGKKPAPEHHAKESRTTPKPKKINKRNKNKGKRRGKALDEEEPNSESPIPCRSGPGWIDGKNGFCYFYSTARANWYEAEARCRNFSATMLGVKDELEQRLAMLGGCDRRTWLGAVRWEPEERWHWHDDMAYVGEGGSYTNWAQNNTGANYVVAFMDTTGNGAGRWYDTPSPHEPMYFICKQPISGIEEGGEGEASGEGTGEKEGTGEGTGKGEEKGEESTIEGTGKGEGESAGGESSGEEEKKPEAETNESGKGTSGNSGTQKPKAETHVTEGGEHSQTESGKGEPEKPASSGHVATTAESSNGSGDKAESGQGQSEKSETSANGEANAPETEHSGRGGRSSGNEPSSSGSGSSGQEEANGNSGSGAQGSADAEVAIPESESSAVGVNASGGESQASSGTSVGGGDENESSSGASGNAENESSSGGNETESSGASATGDGSDTSANANESSSGTNAGNENGNESASGTNAENENESASGTIASGVENKESGSGVAFGVGPRRNMTSSGQSGDHRPGNSTETEGSGSGQGGKKQ